MSVRVEKTKTRIFKNAGYLILSKRLADGTVSKKPEDIYTSDSAIVQSITTKYSYTTEKMEDGNSFWSAAEHATAIDASADIVMNTFDKKLWEFETGARHKILTENGYYRDTADAYIIPEGGIVKIKASGIKDNSLVLARDIAGDDFTFKKNGDPGEGEFTVDYASATLKFNASDAGKSIFVTCYKASKKVSTSSVPALPEIPSFQLEVVGENCDKDETDIVADNFVISNVRVSGDVSAPPRQKNYGSWTNSFAITKPAPGENAIDWITAEKSERNDDDAAPDSTLSALTIGSLTLSPAFDPAVTSYTASTTNATNIITATAAETGAVVSIKNGNTDVASGSAATWAEGENTVTVKVTNDSSVTNYTVKVTKS